MSEGFFSRWSRRKQEVAARASDVPSPALPAESPEPPAPLAPQAAVSRPGGSTDLQDHSAGGALPTIEDAQRLTPQSDFQPFMQRGVGPEVRNAAMKKLFADPHFNVMDGLDIYIDDYNKPDPMPAGMLRKMASAQFMKLVPEEASEGHLKDRDGGAVPAPSGQVVAQSPDSSATADPSSHDHPDLQLQPDPAPASGPSGPDPR